MDREEERRAIAASALLSQWKCTACEEPLDVPNSTACKYCRTAHCPICGVRTRGWDDEPGEGSYDFADPLCSHLMAGYCDESGLWDFPPPWELPASERADRRTTGWTEETLRQAFGELLPLVKEHYDEDLSSVRWETNVFREIAKMITVPVFEVGWYPETGMGSTGGTDFFSPRPEDAEKEMRAIVDRLANGFERLASMKQTEA
jgi:hypothetical protein